MERKDLAQQFVKSALSTGASKTDLAFDLMFNLFVEVWGFPPAKAASYAMDFMSRAEALRIESKVASARAAGVPVEKLREVLADMREQVRMHVRPDILD